LVDGAVTLLAPSLFNDEYNSQKVAAGHSARDRLDAMVNSNRTSRRQRRKAKVDSQSLERQLELWHPFGKRLRLSGVKAGGGIIRDPAKCLTALSSFWSRTFAHRDIDMDQAKDYVATHMSRFVFHTVAPPDKKDFRRFLARVPHSSPGIDGIPYCAWKGAGDEAIDTLFEASLWLQRGLPLSWDFNEALTEWAVKGEEENDHVEVVRSPDSVRPLSLKNSDNKIICGVLNDKLSAPINQGACSLQRGFIKGRNFVNNIIDLDAHARAYATDTEVNFPVMAMYDYGAAFPSLSQDFLFLALDAAGLTPGMYNIAWGIYSMVSGIGRLDDGSSCLLFFIFSGVLQGCPSAGSFFTIAMDPFLRHFEDLIENAERGIVRACADDIGASLRDISSLNVMKCIFDSAKTLAGLALKPTKVVIVPLSPRSWDMLATFVRDWLSENIPEWRGFNIDLDAKYLGAYLGPHGGARLWSAAVAKWQRRAYMIAAQKAPLALTAHMYNTRSVTTLTYSVRKRSRASLR